MLQATSCSAPFTKAFVMPNACPPLHSLPLNTPPRSTVCITEPRSAAPLQKISTGIPVPSCHRGSDSSLHLGQGLRKGHSRAGRVGGRHTTPTRQVERDMPTQAPQTRRGHTPGSCCCIRCSLGRNWDYV